MGNVPQSTQNDSAMEMGKDDRETSDERNNYTTFRVEKKKKGREHLTAF